ncbi:hypothetical protein ACE1SV_14210 [Streptomyces sennicomposti]
MSRVVTEKVVTETMVRVENVHRSYRQGAGAVHALRGVPCEVPRGQLVAVEGRSGSGKTALPDIVGGLDEPGQGRAEVDRDGPSALGEDAPPALRRLP